MNFTCIFFGLAFIVTGVLFAIGKLHVRMGLWRSMTDEEKKEINIAPLCRNIGEIIILCGIIFLLSGIIPQFSGSWFIWAMVAWLIVAGIDVWYISKSKRYRNK